MVKIAGILNVTPDSFSDGGNFLKTGDAVKHAEELIVQGADIIDIGGESSKPGSVPVPEDEEIKRVIPVIKAIKKYFPETVISIDTYKSNVAAAAINEGAGIVNDIYGLRWQNGEIADVIARKNVSVIIMHMLGTPQDMQKNPEYKDVILDICNFFEERIRFAELKGIKKEKIILDPGIGFGKTFKHNLLILRNLAKFKKFKLPIMSGPSRKSFIGNILKTDVTDRIEGSIAASIVSVMNGADYLRVHDVSAIKRALSVFEAIENV